MHASYPVRYRALQVRESREQKVESPYLVAYDCYSHSAVENAFEACFEYSSMQSERSTFLSASQLLETLACQDKPYEPCPWKSA